MLSTLRPVRRQLLLAAALAATSAFAATAAQADDYAWKGGPHAWESFNWTHTPTPTVEPDPNSYPDAQSDTANIESGVVTMGATHTLDYLYLAGQDPATAPDMLDASVPVNLYLTGGDPSGPNAGSTIENASVGNNVTLAVGRLSALQVNGTNVSLGSIRGIASTEYTPNDPSRSGSGSLNVGDGTTPSAVSVGSLELDDISGQTFITVNAGSTLTVRNILAGSGIDGSDSAPNVYVDTNASLVGPSTGIDAPLGNVTVNAGGSFSTAGNFNVTAVTDASPPSFQIAGTVSAVNSIGWHGTGVVFTAPTGTIVAPGGFRFDTAGSYGSYIDGAGTIRGSTTIDGDTSTGLQVVLGPDGFDPTSETTVGKTLVVGAVPTVNTSAAAGNLTLGGNVIYYVAVDSSGDASKLDAAGQLSLGDLTGTPSLFVLAVGTPSADLRYLIASAGAGLNATYNAFDLTYSGGDNTEGYVPVYDATTFDTVGYFNVDYVQIGGVGDVYLDDFLTSPPSKDSTPEPTAVMLLLAAPLAFAGRRQRFV